MPNDSGTKTPIEQGMIDRLVTGVRYMMTGKTPDAWFGPGQPLPPVAQEDSLGARGRAFDYRTGINTTQLGSTRNNEGITFTDMRALADNYDLLRLVIETRKDQLAAQRWKIVPKDEDAQPDDNCKALTDFFMCPDREHTWDAWLRMLLEDMLVIDAATIYPRMTRGGGIYSFDLIDGGTIRRLIDATGRTPVAPDPAYQQILKGLPAVDYSRDELIYAPRNPRTNKIYGFSPVEQVIMTVNIALRRQVHQLNYYTEGNIPDALIAVPPEWNVDQIKAFQNYWDSYFEGGDAQARKRKAKFVPGGMKPEYTQERQLKDMMDEWLARIVCFAFSISPNPLITQVNRATAESQKSQADEEGIIPALKWIKSLMDLMIVKYHQMPDYEFKWDDDDEVDPLVQAQIDQIYVAAKVKHPDEIRERDGLPPLTPEQKEEMNPAPLPMEGDEGGKPGDKPAGKDAKAPPAEKIAKKKVFHRPRRLSVIEQKQ